MQVVGLWYILCGAFLAALLLTAAAYVDWLCMLRVWWSNQVHSKSEVGAAAAEVVDMDEREGSGGQQQAAAGAAPSTTAVAWGEPSAIMAVEDVDSMQGSPREGAMHSPQHGLAVTMAATGRTGQSNNAASAIVPPLNLGVLNKGRRVSWSEAPVGSSADLSSVLTAPVELQQRTTRSSCGLAKTPTQEMVVAVEAEDGEDENTGGNL